MSSRVDSIRRTLGAVALLVLLTLSASAAGLKKGDAAPDLATFGLEGHVPAVKGKVVWLDFWASWCGPCAASFPAMDRIYKKYKDRGLVVVGVSVDETTAAMNKFLAKHPVSFPIVRDASQKLVALANIETMPSSVLIDASGRIVALHSGFKGAETEEAVEKEIAALLGGKKP